MQKKRSDPLAEEVCTTQRAAEILELSVSTVQHLVEAGIIEAWKTKGGHRRIPMRSVLRYKSAPPAGRAPSQNPSGLATVLIIEDNPLQRDLYERQFNSWNLPLSLTFCENGYQALLEIARNRLHILLADIVMDGIDGYEIVKTILADPDLASVHIAILSGVGPAELEQRGGVPAGVAFFAKPLNYDELRGYLRACCAQLSRNKIQ